MWQFWFLPNIHPFPSLKKKKIYLRECVRGGKRQRGREGIASRLPAERRARRGAPSHDPEITTWAETKSRTLNRLSHPGAPAHFLLKTCLLSSCSTALYDQVLFHIIQYYTLSTEYSWWDQSIHCQQLRNCLSMKKHCTNKDKLSQLDALKLFEIWEETMRTSN